MPGLRRTTQNPPPKIMTFPPREKSSKPKRTKEEFHCIEIARMLAIPSEEISRPTEKLDYVFDEADTRGPRKDAATTTRKRRNCSPYRLTMLPGPPFEKRRKEPQKDVKQSTTLILE